MLNFWNNLLYHLQLLIALLSQRKQMYTEVGIATTKSKKATWSRLLNNYSSKFIVLSSTLCRYSMITFLTVDLLYPVILKHQGCTNSGWQVTVATTSFTVVPNISKPSVWNLFHVALLTPRILGWLLDFWNICATNVITIGIGTVLHRIKLHIVFRLENYNFSVFIQWEQHSSDIPKGSTG
jgi:hypothetical protein